MKTIKSWNKSGTRLASGALDCEVIIWDIVEECGLYRLRGHKEKVTSIFFLPRPNEENEALVYIYAILYKGFSFRFFYCLLFLKILENGQFYIDIFRFVVTASADHAIKIWELATQHCQVTNVHHKAQINAMRSVSDLLICASDDAQLRIFRILFAEGNFF